MVTKNKINKYVKAMPLEKFDQLFVLQDRMDLFTFLYEHVEHRPKFQYVYYLSFYLIGNNYKILC